MPTVAVPIFRTAIPDATFASRAASSGDAPAGDGSAGARKFALPVWAQKMK